MSKLYILNTTCLDDRGFEQIDDIYGVVSKEEVAIMWAEKEFREYQEIELDDPELLNKIAKESKKK